ncbi:multidrug resistance-associated protein 1-like [Thrips palmi]|uniref:ABC-type glutathione-S-conjugate transporter n=1 Tax=Thrips palmi TaxID=161013 RepID=A0A6P8YCQ9_THRPL|nr:multidrug resistance-associated protein 1-like [Thrips palmi]
MGDFDHFCGSPFWNITRTWGADNPDFTPCFERTVLAWTPCVFFWLFSPLEVYYILSSTNGVVRWNWLNVSKLLLTLAAMAVSLVDLGHASANVDKAFSVDFVTPIIRVLSYAWAAFLLYWNRCRGLRTSGLLTIFWFLSALFTIAEFRTELTAEKYERAEADRGRLQFYTTMVLFPVMLLTFLLNCFVDQEPTSSPFAKLEDRCPEFDSSFMGKLFFTWYDKMAWRGFRTTLEQKDMWDLNPPDTSKGVVPLFYKHWDKQKRKAEAEAFRTGKPRKNVSVLPALFRCFGGPFAFASAMELVGDLLVFVSPQILKRLMAFTANEMEPMWKGLLYAVAMLVTALLQTLLLSQFNVRMFIVGMRVRTALVSAIYRKSLSMSNVARKDKTVGEIVTLMSVDAQRFLELGTMLPLLWSSPIQIILSLYFLWDLLGIAVLAGLASMILLILVNGFIVSKMEVLQASQLKNKDQRAKLMNEILSGIKVLKLYAWEPPFGDRIQHIRLKEMDDFKKSTFLQAGINTAYTMAPFLVSSRFSRARELGHVVIVKRPGLAAGSEDALSVENASFSWRHGEPPVLSNINLRVGRGRLVAVVGTVGAGKSSLVSALLGEMQKQSGRVNSVGSVAYVPQQAWIQNAKLRDNILFCKDYDARHYNKVIEACALKSDLAMLPGGDQTEIGEKGINLSGGQKQRVSLARAVYCDADVYLLDDPLSAVDSHVGKHIFEQVIGPAGMLANKTRVLVTHGISFLPRVDSIVVLKDGTVSEEGTYQELMQRKGAFAEFLLQHLQAEEGDDVVEDLEEIKAHLEKAVGKDELQRQISQVSLTGSDGVRSRKGSAVGSLKRAGSARSRRRSSATKEEPPKAVAEVPGEKLTDEETMAVGSVKLKVYVHYIRSIRLIMVFLTILFNIVFQGLTVGSSEWVNTWTSDPVMLNASNPGFDDSRDKYLGVYAAFGIGQVVFSMLSSFVFALGCIESSMALHNRMFNRTMKCPMSFFDMTPMGRILNRFTKDIDSVDNVLPLFINQFLYLAFMCLSTIVVISYSTPLFIAVVVPLGVVYFLVQRFYVSTSRQLKRLDAVSRSPIFSHFSETLTGSSSIRAYGVVDRFIEEAEQRIDTNQKCYFPVAIATRWLAVRLETVGNSVIFFAALFAVLSRGSGIAPGTVGLSLSYALQITMVLNWVVHFITEVENNIVSVERIKEYEETPQESPHIGTEAAVSPGWPVEGTVEFRKYAIRYREGLDLVLKGIDVAVKGGEKVGIVGRTGAGKSSLTLGLFRIVEAAEGQILIDGVDIARVNLRTLRSRLTIIPQDPVLFAGSLRVNLDPYTQFSDDEVWRALERSHLKAFVSGLAAGLGHEVAEGGENLSVGQRQLVCLARALLRKTKVLLFDEATAAVDLETDDLIQKTIREDFRDCTILTIAHRLNTIMDSDRVLVLDKGQVAEFDSPKNLLQDKSSMFHSLAKDAGLV